MLIKNQRQYRLAICHIGTVLVEPLKETFYGFFGEERTAENRHYFIHVSVKVEFSLYNGNQAIGTDCSVDLNPDCCLGVTPKGLYTEVLLYPLEEEFHLPPVFVEQDNLFGGQVEIVGVEGERTLEFGNIGHYSPYAGRIVRGVALCGESHGLVTEDVPIIVEILFVLNTVFRIAFFTDDEERAKLLNPEKSFEIPIPLIEYVSCQRLIINHIHCIDIMHGSLGDANQCRYMGNDIQLGMEFYAAFGTSKVSPFKQTHAKVDCGGIESIELAADFKLAVNPNFLGEADHVVGEVLENVPIAQVIAFGEHGAGNRFLAESKMERLSTVGNRYGAKLAQTPASKELSEDKNKQMSPVRELPFLGAVRGVVFVPVNHESFKISLWQIVGYLAENISSCVHGNHCIGVLPKITISKVRQGFQTLKSA